jgi:hypothetical protein
MVDETSPARLRGVEAIRSRTGSVAGLAEIMMGSDKVCSQYIKGLRLKPGFADATSLGFVAALIQARAKKADEDDPWSFCRTSVFRHSLLLTYCQYWPS